MLSQRRHLKMNQDGREANHVRICAEYNLAKKLSKVIYISISWNIIRPQIDSTCYNMHGY